MTLPVGRLTYQFARELLETQIHERLSTVLWERKAMLLEFVRSQEDRFALISGRAKFRSTLERAPSPVTAEWKLEMRDSLTSPVASVRGLIAIVVGDPRGQRLAASDDGAKTARLVTDRALSAAVNGLAFGSPQAEETRYLSSLAGPVLTPNGKVIGVLALLIDMGPVFKLLIDPTGLGESGELILTSLETTGIHYLLPSRFGLAVRNVPVALDPVMADVLRGQAFLGTTTDYRGIEVLAAARAAGFQRWAMMAKIDSSEANEPIDEFSRFLLRIIVALLILALAAAAWTGKHFSDPIVELAQSAERLASRDFTQPVEAPRSDEIGILASTLDWARRELAWSYHSLEEEALDRSRRLEESQAESEAMASAVAAAVEGIARLDNRGCFTYVNRAFAQTLGSDPLELVGAELLSSIATDSKAAVSSCLARLSTPGRHELEVRANRKDGSIFHASIVLVSVPAAPSQDGSYCFLKDVSERKRSEEQVRDTLREKEVLLRELNHRVKNNLQVISSMISIQRGHVTDPIARDVLSDCLARVSAMALVHQRLHESVDLARTSMATYIPELAGGLARTFGFPADSLQTDVADLYLDMDTAVTCGLIVNELISNALEHAFPEGRPGRILVTARALENGSRIQMRVSDNGLGMPPAVDPARASTFGLQLVAALTRQVGGTLAIERIEGTTFVLEFPSSSDG